jgi:crossover junction endodeoxyribonuclease RuvC
LKKEKTGDIDSRVILGIDPGTGRCGWAVLQLKVKSEKLKVNSGLTLLDCGLIETPANTPLSDRLKIIFEKITELIQKYDPTEMAIEELFFVKNVKTGVSVAHARGVIMLAGELANIPVFEYKPNEIKLAIAGHGHADKGQMAKMLKLHLKNCTVRQDDTVDAVAVALTHLQTNNAKRIMYNHK